MTPQQEVLLAKYREASTRADDTIFAMEATIRAQREVIDMLHAQIGKLEQQASELRTAL
jgi:hypothetical protein